MKTKYIVVAALASLMTLPVAAQETYQDTKLIDNDLNGTARYVGMGGAMEALGADISTISTNPAGLGLMRKGQVSLTGGLVSQSDASNDLRYRDISVRINGNQTNASFDQIGIVYPVRFMGQSRLTLGFNYHKSRNFDQILSAGGVLNNASQGKLSALKYDKVGEWGWNGVDANYQRLFEKTGEDGKKIMDYYNGTAYLFGQYQKGYIGEYDFNMSGSINDRVYLGLTVGLHDVNYRSNSVYTENLEQQAISSNWENLKIDGTGFDVKVGAIFLPVEGSPFRIGVYVNSPVFYDLTLTGTNALTINSPAGNGNSDNNCSYDYRVYTPWKFGVSLGHTVSNVLALGATYEYSDYSTIDNRVIDGSYYDPWYGDVYDSSSSDDAMNSHTKSTLKGVHTLKLGAELKVLPTLALRAGYNYLSAVFDEFGFRDGSIESPGVGYATSTNYTNWKATNRFTCGLGFQASKNFSVDLAYQYSQTDGDFYPFMSYDGDTNPANNCVVNATQVSHKRHQLMATLTYRF